VSNVYGPPEPADIFARFGIAPAPLEPYKHGLGPWSHGPFIRPGPDGALQVVVGQFALIGDHDKQPVNRPRMTNNARSEELEKKWTFRGPWERGQRCLIPVDWYDEPNYEADPKKNVWWRIRKRVGPEASGAEKIIAIAGLYNDWIDKATGEVHPSYTMLTVNVEHHDLLRRMHKRDDEKRGIVPIPDERWHDWLTCPVSQARALLVVPPPNWYSAAPRPS
jgi:putative SOS response-associated peptidase YedK